jgi:hypothetical protein
MLHAGCRTGVALRVEAPRRGRDGRADEVVHGCRDELGEQRQGCRLRGGIGLAMQRATDVRHGAGESRQALGVGAGDDRPPHGVIGTIPPLDGREVLLPSHERPGEPQEAGGEGQVAPDHDPRRERLPPDRRAHQVHRLGQGEA